ncbi:EI24 domain-containing protein [Sphingomonas sp. MMSM20]|uniref:EI24 domain-containing protein n=1 Tax=Sphingomonas lycopersici TaxID=2951807 RepID=UPI0022384A24|nr:EI24 domain-containing protein [Sphingomonas lycopersici]MCW6531071.1 EI24 domain-containing protein [Sphingomonas lycopersici]
MFGALALSVAQLGDPRILRVLGKSLLLTLALFVLLGVGLWWGVETWLAQSEWHDEIASAATIVGLALAFWFLFRAVAIAVIGIFADEVVTAVEARHYPAALASARPVPLHRALMMGLGSAARVVAINLLLLPLYGVLLVTGVGTAALFFAVNGWLLGRDLGDMVAARHMDAATLRAWRRTNGARRFLLGLAATGLFVVPLLNILAPVLGAAMATHFFHRGRT